MVWLTACLLAGSAAAQSQVAPTAETDGVRSAGSVSDVALWVSPGRADQSLILLADQFFGLSVMGLDGRERQFISGVVSGVDVQEGFRFGTVAVPLVALAVDPSLSLFTVANQSDGGTSLQFAGSGIAPGVSNVRSVRLYGSPGEGRVFAFVGNDLGAFQQLELTGLSDGGVAITPGRQLSVPGPARAMAVDDAAGALFIAQESGQLWRFDPAPEASDAGTPLDLDGGTLGTAVQGLGLYALGGGGGYLVAVDGTTGASNYTVLNRQSPHAVRGTFTVGEDGGIDGVESGRALALSALPLADAGFPAGLLIAHDGANSGGAQNAKLVSWSSVAQAFVPPLDTSAQDGGTPGDGGTVDGGTPGGGGGVPPPIPGSGGVPDDDDGPACSCAASSVPGAALLGLVAVLLRRRRRSAS
jgi:3-phytase